jgi:hypothetical protein
LFEEPEGLDGLSLPGFASELDDEFPSFDDEFPSFFALSL